MRLLLVALLLLASAAPTQADIFGVPHILEVTGGEIHIGASAAIPAIPPDFFDPGSEPFAGTVVLRGAGPPGILNVLPGPPSTQPETVPIELVQLFLVSVNPIPIHNHVTGSDSFFDVFVELRSAPAPNQHLRLIYDPPTTGPQGGWVVDSFFDITYRIELIPAGGAPGSGRPIPGLPPGEALVGGIHDGLGGPVPWNECFPNSSYCPGLVLGATETGLQPFVLDLGDSSLRVFATAAVPEPGSILLLLACAAAGLLWRRRAAGRGVGCLALTAIVFTGGMAQADVFNMPAGQTSLEFVTVGNPGNAGQLSGAGAGGLGVDGIVGAVSNGRRPPSRPLHSGCQVSVDQDTTANSRTAFFVCV